MSSELVVRIFKTNYTKSLAKNTYDIKLVHIKFK